MGFNYQSAVLLTERIQRDFYGKVTRAELSKLLRELTNTMDARWIKKFAESMVTCGLIEEIEAGVFGVVKK